MELVVLGNNGTCPIKDGACSSFLLLTGTQKILLDAGNGSAAKLQHVCNLKDLDVIIISHLHFDHMADLFCIKYALETRKSLGEEIQPIELIMPAAPQWMLDEIATNHVFHITSIYDGMVLDKAGVQYKFSEVKHFGNSFAVKVENAGKSLVYSGDSAQCTALEMLSCNADVLLCESTIFEDIDDTRTDHHMTVTQAANIAKNAQVKRLLLTHFFTPQKADQYEKKAKQIFQNTESTEILKKFII